MNDDEFVAKELAEQRLAGMYNIESYWKHYKSSVELHSKNSFSNCAHSLATFAKESTVNKKAARTRVQYIKKRYLGLSRSRHPITLLYTTIKG